MPRMHDGRRRRSGGGGTMGLTGSTSSRSFYHRRRDNDDDARNSLFIGSSPNGQSNVPAATTTKEVTDDSKHTSPPAPTTNETASSRGGIIIISHQKKKMRRRKRHSESTSFADEIDSFSFEEPSKRPRVSSPQNDKDPCTATSSCKYTPGLVAAATPAETDFLLTMITPAVSCCASVDSSGVAEQQPEQRQKANTNANQADSACTVKAVSELLPMDRVEQNQNQNQKQLSQRKPSGQSPVIPTTSRAPASQHSPSSGQEGWEDDVTATLQRELEATKKCHLLELHQEQTKHNVDIQTWETKCQEKDIIICTLQEENSVSMTTRAKQHLKEIDEWKTKFQDKDKEIKAIQEKHTMSNRAKDEWHAKETQALETKRLELVNMLKNLQEQQQRSNKARDDQYAKEVAVAVDKERRRMETLWDKDRQMLQLRLRQDAESLMSLSGALRSLAKENEQQRIKLESTQKNLELEKQKVRDLNQQMEGLVEQQGKREDASKEPDPQTSASDLMSKVLNSSKLKKFPAQRSTQKLRAPPLRENTESCPVKRRSKRNRTSVMGELLLPPPGRSPKGKSPVKKSSKKTIPLPSFTACEEGVSPIQVAKKGRSRNRQARKM
jgi:hypothetical protein